MTACVPGVLRRVVTGSTGPHLARSGRHVRRHAFDRQMTPPSRLIAGSR